MAVGLGAATILASSRQGAIVRADGLARLEDEAEAALSHGGACNPHRATSEGSEALPALAPPAPLRAALQGTPIETHEDRL